jgi:hypothetical protein
MQTPLITYTTANHRLDNTTKTLAVESQKATSLTAELTKSVETQHLMTVNENKLVSKLRCVSTDNAIFYTM